MTHLADNENCLISNDDTEIWSINEDNLQHFHINVDDSDFEITKKKLKI